MIPTAHRAPRPPIAALTGILRYHLRTGQTVIDLPFECRLCDESRMDFEMIDGDGFPICRECFDLIDSACEPGEKEDWE